jgi:hypothetical protein
MMRITKADRGIAVSIIRDALDVKKNKLKMANADHLAGITAKADKLVEDKYKIQKVLNEAVALREKANKLEVALKTKLGVSQYTSISHGRQQQVEVTEQELLSKDKVGKQIIELETQYKSVAKRVFLATTNEELVQLVNELGGE